MSKWKVTVNLVSTRPTNEKPEPVDVVWMREGSEIDAMLCVAQNLRDADATYTKILKITIDRV